MIMDVAVVCFKVSVLYSLIYLVVGAHLFLVVALILCVPSHHMQKDLYDQLDCKLE